MDDDFEDFNVYKKRTSLWVKLILLLLLLTGLFIGWATNESYIKQEPLQESILQAFNSPLTIKDYSMGLIIYDNIKEEKLTELDIIIDRVVQCESQNQDDVWGDLTLSEPVYGIAQFRNSTFLWLENISGYKNLEWKNPDHQIILLRWAIEHNYGYLWTCYRKLGYI